MNWDEIARQRLFGVQHFGPPHGSLLIRSESNTGEAPNINVDVVAKDVRYLCLPRLMRGISIERPTSEEIDQVMGMTFLEGPVSPRAIHVIVSGGRRHLLVANYLAKEFNEGYSGVLPWPTSMEDFRDPKWKNHKPVEVYLGTDE